MKIKLAVLHSDVSYLRRFTSVMEMKYNDKLALYSFTDPEIALSALTKEKIDVFLADDSFRIEPAQLPPKCGFAYFVDSPDVDLVNGCHAICKYQRIELMYKQILGVFSDALGNSSVRNIYSENAKVIIFSSPCGGTGTSTLAAACAAHFANAGKRSLYLNFERFGEADAYFSAEGASNMSDVVYAVKSGRGNLPIKLESCVKRDNCGVYYFSATKVALDMMELTSDEKEKLISVLVNSNNYDYIIIDMDFDLEKQTLSLLRQAHMLVWVSDGLVCSNSKIVRAYAALSVLERNEQNPLSERVCVMPYLVRKRNNERIPINKGVFRLGRDAEYNDYAVTDNRYIGHGHCHIVTRDGEYFVVDDNSKNHTKVNGEVITPGVEVKIAHGYTICLADEDFEFRLY